MSAEEVAIILNETSPNIWEDVFQIASELTQRYFKKRLHFFAPLYFSNFCVNDCHYCGFRATNSDILRKVLSREEFVQEARFLWNEGHRSLLLIAGEHPVYSGIGQIVSYVLACRREGLDFSFMLEVGPLSVEDYGILNTVGINHCLLFQESYDRKVYADVHHGKKADYEWRLNAMERAFEGGFQKIGLGVLLGLHSWQEEIISLIAHARRIKEVSGCFPATFSFPRLRPAVGNSVSGQAVSDANYKKALAVSRLASPETGIVLTTRESPEFRYLLLKEGIGVTHMSGGAKTTPGGYTLDQKENGINQFELADHRSFAEVIREVRELGYEPCDVENVHEGFFSDSL